MKNFVYIYHYDTPTAEPSEGAMEAWNKWFESMGDSIVDSGNPFDTHSVAQVMDGKVTMNQDTAIGYTVVKAENLEAAVKMAMGCPMAVGTDSSVHVYETMPM